MDRLAPAPAAPEADNTGDGSWWRDHPPADQNTEPLYAVALAKHREQVAEAAQQHHG